MRSLFISMVIVALAGCDDIRSQHTGGVKRIRSIDVKQFYPGAPAEYFTTRIRFENRGWIELEGDVSDDWQKGDLVAVDGRRLILLRGVEDQGRDGDEDEEGADE